MFLNLHKVFENKTKVYLAFPGGGTQSIFPTGMCCFSGYRFHLFLSSARYQKKVFSRAGCQKMSRGDILQDGVVFSVKVLRYGIYFSPIFLESDIVWRKKLLSQVRKPFSRNETEMKLDSTKRLEQTQYPAVLCVTGAWRGTSRQRLFEELG